MRKSCSGFTLVELLVAIAASTLVVAAAASFMLFGMRMEKAASDDAALQSDSRVILRVLENIASEMSVTDVKYIDGNNEEMTQDTIDKIHEKEFEDDYRWELYATSETGKLNKETKAGECILGFDTAEQAIIGKDGAIIVENVASSTISYENRVLKCEIETTAGDAYSASVYCRVGSGEIVLAEIEPKEEKEAIDPELWAALLEKAQLQAEMESRINLLTNLAEQYGSTGRIYDNTIFNGYEFATWYWAKTSRDVTDEWATEPETIPWCALFVSWGLNKTIEEKYGTSDYQLLSPSVNNMMWYQFDRQIDKEGRAVDPENNNSFDFQIEIDTYKRDQGYETLGKWYYPYEMDEGLKEEYLPNPGDLVFFENLEGNERADHVGVVLYVMPETPILDENGIETGKTPQTIYTVEGNHDDRVGVFSYSFVPTPNTEDLPIEGVYTDGTSVIIGYGAIDWAELGLLSTDTSNQ